MSEKITHAPEFVCFYFYYEFSNQFSTYSAHINKPLKLKKKKHFKRKIGDYVLVHLKYSRGHTKTGS